MHDADMRTTEINNGRLAKFSAIGIIAADALTSKGGMALLGCWACPLLCVSVCSSGSRAAIALGLSHSRGTAARLPRSSARWGKTKTNTRTHRHTPMHA